MTTRYKIDYDPDARFEECNGEPRPLTAEEYADNEYMRDGKPVSYADYLEYYGNPDRHVYLSIFRQDQCPCCHSWVNGDSVHGIDCMDDQPEAHQIGTFTAEQLTGYLKDVANELDPPAFHTPAGKDAGQ